MKILQLQAENIKKLKVVEITPAGNMVEITGQNGAGKTSVLDSIWWALAGAGQVQAVPIRIGETEAKIWLDLGELKVTRAFKQKDDGQVTTSIVVEAENGARFPSPQKVLNDLLGALSFDPLAFTRMSPKEQFDALKSFVPGVDFAAIEQANKATYDERTAINRKAREQDALAASIALTTSPDVPREFVDEAALLDALTTASATNAHIARDEAVRAAAVVDTERKRHRVGELGQRIAELEAEADRLDVEGRALLAEIAVEQAVQKAMPPLPAPVDAADLQSKLVAAQELNKAVARRKQREIYVAAAERHNQEAYCLTARIEARIEARNKAIAAAKMPVDGLSFGEDVVLLNGVPFEQASTAEQLRTSIAIAMANNPKLRVIRVRDGSVLDKAGLAALAEAAQQNDFQVWIEMVESDKPTAIHIEDGVVK